MREILISESAWEEMTCLFAPSLRQSGLFIHRSALNAYLSITGEELIYRRFANRGYFDLAGRNGSQIDLKTWIQYRADKAPVVLREEELPFNC
ncbi:hypothetical protein ACOY7W_20535 [Enterobacter asburiae]|uniref:hypothetical protein n=1 Tax=Enterobacter asburiae TaxID=61645 RepID=UPI003BEF4AE6